MLDTEEQQALFGAIGTLVEADDAGEASQDLDHLVNRVIELRRGVDHAVNNAGITGKLEVEVLTNPGELVFAAARSSVRNLSGLGGISITFLIDEYENLSIDQQRYLNTLLREKVLPTTFLIGSRSWGVKTHETLSAREENRRGSEYDWIELGETYRSTARHTEASAELAVRELKYLNFDVNSIEELKDSFEVPDHRGLADETLLR